MHSDLYSPRLIDICTDSMPETGVTLYLIMEYIGDKADRVEDIIQELPCPDVLKNRAAIRLSYRCS